MSNTVRYANDLLLTDLVRRLNAEHKSFGHHLTDGNLHAAFLRCLTMQKQLDGIMYRLNDIQRPPLPE